MKAKALALALAASWPPLAGAQDADALTGDAAAGADLFSRQCVSCHVVANEAGEALAGRGARVGPNLYGVAGRTPGSVEGFRYSPSMRAYGETGAAWDEAGFVPYVMDPTGFLREALADPRARGKMAYNVRDEQDAHDLWAYLASVASRDGAPEGSPGE